MLQWTSLVGGPSLNYLYFVYIYISFLKLKKETMFVLKFNVESALMNNLRCFIFLKTVEYINLMYLLLKYTI